MNNTYSCMIIDDDPAAIELLQQHIGTLEQLRLEATETDPLRALTYLRRHPIDLLFLDVQMPKINGVELAKALIPRPAIILTTGYPEFAADGYDLGVPDCIVKPVTLDRFSRAVYRALDWKKDANPIPLPEEYIVVRDLDKQATVRIFLVDIRYIESDSNETIFHLTGGDARIDTGISKIEALLPAAYFIRVHRSVIVPKWLIYQKEKGRKIRVQGVAKPISVGRTYWDSFNQYFDGYGT